MWAPYTGAVTSTPTYDGSGRVTHPSVVDMGGGGWNGFRWWLIDTPFPLSDETLENPSILGSVDRTTWEVPSGLTNPIDPWPGGDGYNSDPELVWDPEGRRMVAYWRETPSPSAPTRPIWAATSHDGITWEHYPSAVLTLSTLGAMVSPSVARVSARDWRMWVLGSPSKMYTAESPLGPWAAPVSMTLTAGGSLSSYHGDFLYAPNARAYFGISQDGDGLARPFASRDGIAWAKGDPLLSGSYRLTMTPPRGGMVDVWYSASQWQRYTRIPARHWTDLLL